MLHSDPILESLPVITGLERHLSRGVPRAQFVQMSKRQTSQFLAGSGWRLRAGRLPDFTGSASPDFPSYNDPIWGGGAASERCLPPDCQFPNCLFAPPWHSGSLDVTR